MTEPHKQIGTATRTVEVMSAIAVALTVLSFIYVERPGSSGGQWIRRITSSGTEAILRMLRAPKKFPQIPTAG